MRNTGPWRKADPITKQRKKTVVRTKCLKRSREGQEVWWSCPTSSEGAMFRQLRWTLLIVRMTIHPFLIRKEPQYYWGQRYALLKACISKPSLQMGWHVTQFQLNYISWRCWMKFPEQVLQLWEWEQREKGVLGLTCLLLIRPLSVPSLMKKVLGKEWLQPWVCSKETKRSPRTWPPPLNSFPRSAAVCLPTAHCLRKIKPVICSRLCFGGPCSSQLNIIPDPYNRQHFVSIINLEIMHRKFTCSRVSCSHCPWKEPGHPLGTWKSFHRAQGFVLGCLPLL